MSAGAVSDTRPTQAGDEARCLACDAPLTPEPFCARCGQKAVDCRRSIFRLAGDMINQAIGYDARLWRTVRDLFVAPGRAQRAFAHGKRSFYTPPVRLFVIVSFLFLFFLSVTDTLFVSFSVEFRDAAAPAPETTGISMIASYDDQVGYGTLQFFTSTSRIEPSVLPETFRARIEETDSAVAAAVMRGVVRAVEDPVGFSSSFNAWLSRAMVVLMPMIALLMAIFFRGREALIFDHLVTSVYFHSVALAMVGAGLVLAGVVPGAITALVAIAFLLSYFIISIRRIYRRGWIKTVLSGLSVALLYSIVLVLTTAFVTFLVLARV